MTERLLDIKNLKTYFYTDVGTVKAVDGVSFHIDRRKTMGLVGESGCGKSVTARSILQIIPPPGKITGGEILFHDRDDDSVKDLAAYKPTSREMRSFRGSSISMIFQDPMTCLSPVHTIGNQIIENVRENNTGIGKKEARERAIELLGQVGMPNPRRQVDVYTFELSGGMRQRAMIAVALAGGPELIIADEPTTAVDVTIQAKIMDLLKKLQHDNSMSILFITHDLGLIAEMSEDVAVMYLGKIVEQGRLRDIYHDPMHPYTQVLLKCIPQTSFKPKSFLATIEGSVPDPFSHPPGCPFSNRCSEFMQGVCDRAMPELLNVAEEHTVACYRYSDSSRSGETSDETREN